MAATEKSPELRKRAMAAAATLLGLAPSSQAANQPPAPDSAPLPSRWTWDTSFLQYMESDRISVTEPQVGVRRDFGDERALSILATVDSISGSTPLGTLPLTAATAPATVTGPSGHPVNPLIGKVPVSDMTDTRIGLNTTYEKPYTSISRGIYGLSGSAERDFYSMGANYTYERDYHQKNTVLAFGVSPEFDAVKPHGGLPGEYSTLLSPEEKVGTRDGKYLVGGLIGVTQIINPRTLMQWNYAPTYENGYLNDPYKLLSVTNANGDPLNSIHEKRPGSRLQHSFFWLTRYNFVDQDVFSLGLRYFADDWGIRSQTIDFHYRWQYHPKHFLEPHIRYYHQTAAGFYRSGLLNTDPLPAHASADYRLTDLDGVTFGLAVGWTFKNESELVMRAEYYTLSGEDSPNDAVGAQQAFDLFPTIHAAIIQFDYRFEPSKVFRRKGGF